MWSKWLYLLEIKRECRVWFSISLAKQPVGGILMWPDSGLGRQQQHVLSKGLEVKSYKPRKYPKI